MRRVYVYGDYNEHEDSKWSELVFKLNKTDLFEMITVLMVQYQDAGVWTDDETVELKLNYDTRVVKVKDDESDV